MPISEDAIVAAVERVLGEGFGDKMKRFMEVTQQLEEARVRDGHLRVAESTVRGLNIPAPMEARVMEAVSQDTRLVETNADPAAIAKSAAEAEMRYARSLNPQIGMFYAPDQRGSIEENQKAIDENLDAIFGPLDDPKDEE